MLHLVNKYDLSLAIIQPTQNSLDYGFVILETLYTTEDLRFIKRSVLFQGTLPQERERMLAECRLEEFEADRPLFQSGSPVHRVFLILEGVVQLFRGAEEGKHAIIGLREVGEVAGITASLSGNRHYSTAQSIGKCRALEVPSSVFSELLERDADLSPRLVERLADNLQNLSMHIERLQLMQTTERLASYLLAIMPDKPQTCGKNDVTDILLPCDKGVIATYLGMERESFSRSLKKLRSVGVVSKGRRIQITDPAALKELCN